MCVYVCTYVRAYVCSVCWSGPLVWLCLSQPCTKSLQDINLSNNRVGDYGVMMAKLSLLANRSLLKLTLCNTRITCEGTDMHTALYTHYSTCIQHNIFGRSNSIG